jgi:endonuclease YncB( thermonuclease family)
MSLIRILLFIFLFNQTINLAEAKEKTNFCIGSKDKSCQKRLENSDFALNKFVFERVIDGDTFVASGKVIRVWGIDAPESNQIGYKVAGWYLESQIKDQELKCRLFYLDRYARQVMQCYVDDIDIASRMVRFGMAKDYKKYSGSYYEQEEIKAKNQKKGIWSLNKK